MGCASSTPRTFEEKLALANRAAKAADEYASSRDKLPKDAVPESAKGRARAPVRFTVRASDYTGLPEPQPLGTSLDESGKDAPFEVVPHRFGAKKQKAFRVESL